MRREFLAVLAAVLATAKVGASGDEIPVGLIVSDWSEYSGVISAINIAVQQQRSNSSLSNATSTGSHCINETKCQESSAFSTFPASLGIHQSLQTDW